VTAELILIYQSARANDARDVNRRSRFGSVLSFTAATWRQEINSINRKEE
jgi:hypothetical protein